MDIGALLLKSTPVFKILFLNLSVNMLSFTYKNDGPDAS